MFLAKVKDIASGATLVEVCTLAFERSGYKMIRFRAPQGAIVEEEVVLEKRSEDYEGSDAVHGGTVFWCSDAPKAERTGKGSSNLRSVKTCFVVADADPPAKILEIEPRGLSLGPTSTGYAMKLEILHPGVLNVRADAECMARAFGQTVPDGGLPPSEPRVELEVL